MLLENMKEKAMKGKRIRKWNWGSNLSFKVPSIIILFSLLFSSVPIWAVQFDVGYVMIDGEKTIVLGWYKSGETNPAAGWPKVDNLETVVFAEASEHGFDFVMQYYPWRDVGGVPSNNTEVLAWMDAAEANGVKIMIDIHSQGLITEHANTVKDHNALYGYYLEDEPDGRYYDNGVEYVSPANVIANYNTLRTEDPDMNHPACIAFAFDLTDARAQNYFPACDLAAAECYATDWGGPFSSEYPNIPNDVNVAKDAGMEYVTLPRLFGTSDVSIPTPEEFRYTVFAPISMGVGGIMPFTYEGWVPLPEGPGAVNEPELGFRDVLVYPATDQLVAIREILLRGDLVATSNHGDDDITWVFGGDANEAVLVAVNNNPWFSKSSVDFTLSGLNPSVRTALVLGENQTAILDTNGFFTDDFDPYGVHIYHFVSTPFCGDHAHPYRPGDLDRNCHVDFNDFAILAGGWADDTAPETGGGGSPAEDWCSVEAKNSGYSYSATPTVGVYDAVNGMEYIRVGNHHGLQNPKQLFAGYMQFDLSSFAGETVIGGGHITFYAKIQTGHTEQPGGFQVHELNRSYVQSEVCWNESETDVAWTDSGEDYWDLGGTGDMGALVGGFYVTTHDYAQRTMVVPDATIQGWIDGGSTINLLFVPTLDGFYAYRVIQVGADNPVTSPGVPTLMFKVALPPACGDDAHPYPAGDVDNNCVVDMRDIKKMAEYWLVCTALECD